MSNRTNVQKCDILHDFDFRKVKFVKLLIYFLVMLHVLNRELLE